MKDRADSNGAQSSHHEAHNSPIDKLADSIDHLAAKVDDFMSYSKNSVHIKVVILMFGILVLTIIGVQGAEFLFKQYLPRVLGAQ